MKTMVPSRSTSRIGGADRDIGPATAGGIHGAGFSMSWLGGLGVGAGAAGPPSRQHGTIADDIRNDQELFFVDDEPPPLSTPSAHQMMMMASSVCSDGESYRQILEPLRRSQSSTTTSVKLPRHSSQQKMEDLQREVDLALEFFSQETENELDHSDGDDYLHHHEKHPLLEKLHFHDGDSSPGTAATSMATSVSTDDESEFSDCHTKLLSFSEQSSLTESETQTPRTSGAGLSLKHRTKSIISLPLSLLPSQTVLNCSADKEDASVKFEHAIAEELNKISRTEEQRKNFSVDFNSSSSLRNAMEPFLAVARLQREEARQRVFDTLDKVMMPHEPQECASHRVSTSSEFSFHIGSTFGVPYPALRSESSFLYNEDSFPLDRILAETLGIDDLSKLHIDNPLIKDKGRLMAPLQNRGKRRKFHQCFDSFVTSQVIPLLHFQALSKGVFYTNRHQLQKGKPQSIIYRYQAFPTINIVRPGECSTDPHCDMAQGHSIGNISYHIPLTATFGTNAVYTESQPGREDWHPLVTKSPGLGFQFDGARCLHFNLKNETDITRVSLNFQIAITRAPESCAGIDYDTDDQLCCPELLKDKFSQENFYDEVVVNVGNVPRSFLPGPVATKRKCAISVVG